MITIKSSEMRDGAGAEAAVGTALGPSGSLERVAVAELVHFNHLLCKFLCCKRSSEFKSIFCLLLLLTLLLPFSAACVLFCVYVCVCEGCVFGGMCVCVLCAFTLCVCVANICKKTTHAAKLHNGSTAPWLHSTGASPCCATLLLAA